MHLPHLTVFAGKVLDSYVLDGDLLQEVRTLAARITCHNAFPSQPIPEPSEVTVTVEGISEKVSGEQRREGAQGHMGCISIFVHLLKACLYSQCGQRVQRVEGTGVHRGDLVVVERQQTYRAQPHKAAVAHTADPVTPQHATQTHSRAEEVQCTRKHI